jgi:hypothetical protein
MTLGLVTALRATRPDVLLPFAIETELEYSSDIDLLNLEHSRHLVTGWPFERAAARTGYKIERESKRGNVWGERSL